MESKGKINLMDMNIQELEQFLLDIGQPRYRARQVMEWLNRGVQSVDDMSNLPGNLREELGRKAHTGSLDIMHRLVSNIDGTVKYIFGLWDGNIIESVLMNYKHGLTVCVSSQVGCKMGCTFCASTGAGFARNLSAGEILGQVVAIQRDQGKRIGNVVIMGIGEPFDNYENVLKFLKLLNSPDGLNIGYRHITISTCGLVPKIIELSKENIPVNLSISLHAPDDELRSSMMPVNRKYSIDKIIEACKIYTEATKRRVTFEYAVIAGINDSDTHARELGARLKGMLCHVNLIPVNSVKGTGYKQSGRKNMERFKMLLERWGIETTIRRELGEDINAACGQLRRSIIEEQSRQS